MTKNGAVQRGAPMIPQLTPAANASASRTTGGACANPGIVTTIHFGLRQVQIATDNRLHTIQCDRVAGLDCQHAKQFLKGVLVLRCRQTIIAKIILCLTQQGRDLLSGLRVQLA